MDIVFLSDYFTDDFIGGAALNDDVLIARLTAIGNNVLKIKSKNCDIHLAKSLADRVWIVSNFFLLREDVKNFITGNIKYAIIAHDYKFVQHTNPAQYQGMVVPEGDKINVDFHNKAICVFCQSSLQKQIFDLNLPKCQTVNLSGNMWSDKILEFMSVLAKRPKKDSFCVVKSPFPQKGVPESIAELIKQKKDYELIYDKDPAAFLNKLAMHSGFCMISKTPETLCRVAVEAKMCGMAALLNKMVGAAHEPWFNDKDILKIITQKQKDIPALIASKLA
jgi:hypothetical protein